MQKNIRIALAAISLGFIVLLGTAVVNHGAATQFSPSLDWQIGLPVADGLPMPPPPGTPPRPPKPPSAV